MAAVNRLGIGVVGVLALLASTPWALGMAQEEGPDESALLRLIVEGNAENARRLGDVRLVESFSYHSDDGHRELENIGQTEVWVKGPLRLIMGSVKVPSTDEVLRTQAVLSPDYLFRWEEGAQFGELHDHASIDIMSKTAEAKLASSILHSTLDHLTTFGMGAEVQSLGSGAYSSFHVVPLDSGTFRIVLNSSTEASGPHTELVADSNRGFLVTEMVMARRDGTESRRSVTPIAVTGRNAWYPGHVVHEIVETATGKVRRRIEIVIESVEPVDLTEQFFTTASLGDEVRGVPVARVDEKGEVSIVEWVNGVPAAGSTTGQGDFSPSDSDRRSRQGQASGGLAYLLFASGVFLALTGVLLKLCSSRKNPRR